MTQIRAAALSGEHIDEAVRFHWQLPVSRVDAEVWGVVREVHHNGGDVTVWLTSPYCDTGDKAEFVLAQDTDIMFVTDDGDPR